MKIYKLREAKTNQLKKLLKNGNITEDQFQIADEFFRTYSAFENEIDWNRGLKITWDTLMEVRAKKKERNQEEFLALEQEEINHKIYSIEELND